jgi:hypothetical protein
MPLLQQLRHSYRGDGLEIVGIAVDFRSAVADYVRRQAVEYPLLIGEDAGLAATEQFGMQTVLPFSVFADATGGSSRSRSANCIRMKRPIFWRAMRDLAAGRIEPCAGSRRHHAAAARTGRRARQAGAKDR